MSFSLSWLFGVIKGWDGKSLSHQKFLQSNSDSEVRSGPKSARLGDDSAVMEIGGEEGAVA